MLALSVSALSFLLYSGVFAVTSPPVALNWLRRFFVAAVVPGVAVPGLLGVGVCGGGVDAWVGDAWIGALGAVGG
eukprot:COSAG05_NODE_20112_length_283_cov_0.510870_1_plen_74_part_01